MAELIDVHGRPLRSALKKAIAEPTLTGVRSLMIDAIAPGLTPQRMAAILRAAEQDQPRDYLTLAEEMEERDCHYISVLGTRKRALTRLDIVIEEGAEDGSNKEIADEVRRLTERPVFLDLIGDLVDALGKGYAVAEIVWDTSDSRWTPAEYVFRDQRFFLFDRLTRRKLRLAVDGSLEGVPLPPYKFVGHVPRLKSGVPIRGGLAKPAAWAFIFKSYTLKDWAAFAEVYGMPIRVGKYGPNASSEDRQKLLAAVRNIGTDAAAIIPETMTIEFVEAGKGVSTGGAAVFAGLAEYLDKQISKLVLGQTMTTDDGASLAQAKVHQTVRVDIQAADAVQLENTLNRDIVRPFIELNWGRQEVYPRITLPVAENEDLTALAGNLAKLVPLGFRVREAELRDRFGFTDPEEGELVLGPMGIEAYRSQPAPAPQGEENHPTLDDNDGKKGAPSRARKPKLPKKPAKSRTRKAANAAAVTVPRQRQIEEDLDALEALSLGDWQDAVDPLLAPVRQAANDASSYEEFLARLPAVFADMDAGRLIEFLAAAMAQAKGMGDAAQSA
jgi:phage gp29-like protein